MRGLKVLARAERLDGGLVTGVAPTEQPPATTPSALNCRFEDGAVILRPGLKALGDALDGDPALIYQFRMLDGTKYPVVITTTKGYAWISNDWEDITNTALNASLTDNHSAATFLNKLIFTNSVDAVQTWAGGTGNNFVNLGGASDYQSSQTVHKCKALCVHENRLHLFNTIEDGVSCPQRHRRSELGKIDEWKEDEGGAFDDLVEDPGGIVAAHVHLEDLLIFKEHSIIRAHYVGEGGTYDYETYTNAEGCTAPRTVVGTYDAVMFVGRDNVYMFTAGRMRSIGTPVWDELFGRTPPGERRRAFAQLWPDEHLYVLYVPVLGASVRYAYAYDYLRDRWARWDAPEMSGAGVIDIGTAVTYGDLSGTTYGELGGRTYGDFYAQEGRGRLVVGDEDGQVYEMRFDVTDDDGSNITQYYDTPLLYGLPDYTDQYKRWLEVDFEARGDSVSVLYSTDRGRNFHPLQEVSLDAGEWRHYTVPMDVYSRQLVLRFQNIGTKGGFGLRWYQVSGLPRGDR